MDIPLRSPSYPLFSGGIDIKIWDVNEENGIRGVKYLSSAFNCPLATLKYVLWRISNRYCDYFTGLMTQSC